MDKQQVSVEVEGSLSVNNLDLALRGALDGVGFAQLPESLIAPYLADGRLLPVLTKWHACWGELALYYSNRRHVPMALRNLMDLLRRESRNSSPRRLLPAPRSGDPGRHRMTVPDIRHQDSFHPNGRNSHLVAAISAK
jgi:hypothetical protein